MADRTILGTIKLLMLVFSALLATGCAMVHRYDSYYGKVIDTETKEPLEGAAVLAVYYTQQYGPAGSITHYVDAQETLTDKNGEFKIPSLTVTTFRPLQTFESLPRFKIFKPGYGCYPDYKGIKHVYFPAWSLPADKYVTVELPRLRTREERLNNLFELDVNYKIPYIKQKNLFDLRNEEAIQINKKPWPIPKDGGN